MNTDSTQYDHLVKILLIGESGVGKTCILQKFCKGDFLVNHLTTIAIDFKMKMIDVDGNKLKMQIWDTAGQERFDTLTSSFFKSAQGIMICYSITDEQSFQSVNKWTKQIQNLAPKDVKVVMLGNKLDLDHDRTVSTESGEELARSQGIEFFEVSAFNGKNIDTAFHKLAKMILETMHESSSNENTNLNFQSDNSSKGCC